MKLLSPENSDDVWLFDAIRTGASGYLRKDTLREKVIEAIRGTVSGQQSGLFHLFGCIENGRKRELTLASKKTVLQ